jgi:hypothetical protein
MKEQGCVFIKFDKGRVAIRWEGRDAFDILDYLFKENLHILSDSAVPLFTLKTEEPESLVLNQGDTTLCKGDRGNIAVRLLRRVVYEMAKVTRSGPVFHAAALSRNGCSILIPGKSGSGKTFLAAGLAVNGFSYLTDEMTLINTKDLHLKGFLKPLHIKDSQAYERYYSQTIPAGGQSQPGLVHLPVFTGFLTNCFRNHRDNRQSLGKATMIVFPRYERSAELHIERLGPANTGLLLLESLINAGNLASRGFHEISALSRKIPAYRVTYGNASQSVGAVESLLP